MERRGMTLPTWQANHTYLAGAVVAQTTGLPLWRCTTGGVSGGSEPAWPAGPPFLTNAVSDGAVTWVPNTTFRQDVHAGIISTLTAWKAANPTLLRAIWH